MFQAELSRSPFLVVSNSTAILLVPSPGRSGGQAMRSCYFEVKTRSMLDLIPPSELFPGWTISRISVLPPHRSQGLARELLRRVIADAEVEGVVLFLEVQPDASGTGLSFDELYAWYARAGFEPSTLGYPSMVRIPQVMGLKRQTTIQDIAERLVSG
jgi:GNAT superfamily N-acetyltransferase